MKQGLIGQPAPKKELRTVWDMGYCEWTYHPEDGWTVRAIKDYVRTRPALYDRVRRLKRLMSAFCDPSFSLLDEFSRSHGGRVNFIQIGANDGLRNDPLRPLIVRDDWHGVFIEPLPTVFPLLKKNYAYLNRPNLIFINAAITADGRGNRSFWTFTDSFLQAQSREDRLDYLRKSSFSRDHAVGFIPPEQTPADVLREVSVRCLGLEQVVDDYLPRRPLHLLAIDVEGYEGRLIPALDFSANRPTAIFFESEHLGKDQTAVFDHLHRQGYDVEEVGQDCMCRLRGSR